MKIIIISCLTQSPQTNVQNKLDQVCIDIVKYDRDKQFLEKNLNLDDPDISNYMLVKINTPPIAEHKISLNVIMYNLIKTNPGKTVEWFLDNYSQFSTTGLANMSEALRHSNNRECYQLLFRLLKDHGIIIDEYASRVSARPYISLRVCDQAYIGIMWLLYKTKLLPKGLPALLTTSTSIEKRDEQIQRLEKWWKGESSLVLEEVPALSIQRPGALNPQVQHSSERMVAWENTTHI